MRLGISRRTQLGHGLESPRKDQASVRARPAYLTRNRGIEVTRDRPGAMPMSDTFSRVEIITGVARRRRFTTEQKLAVVAETMQPGMSISYVARRHGLSPSLVFR
jgi:hypothetical protein